MKRILIASIASAALSFALFGDAAKRANEDLYKLKGKGFVAAIDCRAGASSSDYADGVKEIQRRFGIIVSNFAGRAFTLANAGDQRRICGAPVAVYIVDDPALPLALSAREERWTLLNASKCKTDTPDAKTLRHRLSVLFARQCCRVLGMTRWKPARSRRWSRG